jgi:uncharacterized protein YrrD
VRKLVATTALALIIGGPAVAQATQDPAQQPADQQQAGQEQMQAQDQQQVGQDQPMMAAGGFYQPDANDIFISDLMDAAVYAPQMREEAGMQQPQDQQQAQPADTAAQQDQDVAADPQMEGEQELEQAETEPADTAEPEVAADETDPALEEQQAGVGQDQPDMAADQQMQAGTQPGQAATGMQDQQMAAGQQLQTRQVTQQELEQYENIGSVSDMIVDEQGQLRAIVLDVGGFLGMGAREVALDVGEIEIARDQEQPDTVYIISRVGADELEQAPEFDRAALEEQRQQQAGMAQDGTVQEQQEQAAAAGPDAQQAEQPAQQNAWRGDRQTLAAPQMQREGFQQAEAAEITADNLIGANVYDVNDENIGSVSDIVMGPDGQAEYAVIDVGGFLGFGTHTVAIGFDEMQVLHDEGWADLRVYVDVTQEELENMPEYEGN